MMKNTGAYCIIISLWACLFLSCNRSVSEQPGQSEDDQLLSFSEDAREVEVIILHRGDFRRDIVSNGRLTALRKSDLEFRTRERIASIKVRNGDLVASGDIIASLDTFSLNNALLLSLDQYKRSVLEFRDLLLARGYSNTDTSMIPPAVVMAARVRSGLDKAIADLRMAEYNLEQAHLRAPFKGVVADLFAHENEMSVPGKAFCSVIDNSRFIAYFPVLESEVSSLRKGQTVRIEPFMTSGDAYPGKITSINPVVDDNGMVKIGAVADNRKGALFEGMNVKVTAGEVVAGQLVIPRQAVVLRSERKVVFTYSGGRAKWVYVTTGLENIESFTVTEGLKEGDTVIVRGNFNLNHDSRVVIK
jgi:RND family efflux transporter MFP subunit